MSYLYSYLRPGSAEHEDTVPHLSLWWVSMGDTDMKRIISHRGGVEAIETQTRLPFWKVCLQVLFIYTFMRNGTAL